MHHASQPCFRFCSAIEGAQTMCPWDKLQKNYESVLSLDTSLSRPRLSRLSQYSIDINEYLQISEHFLKPFYGLVAWFLHERNGKKQKKLPGKPPLCNLLVPDVPATKQPGLAMQLSRDLHVTDSPCEKLRSQPQNEKSHNKK